MPINVTKYFWKIYVEFTTRIYDIPPRMLGFLSFIILATIPLMLDPTKLDFLIIANIFAILAASWDLLVGRTGQISLGHAIFYAIGGYSTALLYMYFKWPLWLTIPLSLLVGAISAFVIGLPCLRVKGPYLALLTFALPFSVKGFIYYYSDIFGGDAGIPPIPDKLYEFFPMLSGDQKVIANYYLSLGLMAISAIILYKIATSKTGLTFVSILDDELASKACGINVTKYKLMAFIISGMFGSLAGTIYAHMIQHRVDPLFLDVTYSVYPIIATIIGGIGTIYGPIAGAYIYCFLDRYLFQYVIPYITIPLGDHSIRIPLGDKDVRMLLFAAIVVFLIIKWPRGIARAIVEKLEDLQEPREIEEIEKEKKFKSSGVAHAPA